MSEQTTHAADDGGASLWRRLGALFLALPMLVLVCVLSVVSYGRDQLYVRHQMCMDNMRQLGKAMLQYEEDSDGAFPLSQRWADSISPYLTGNRQTRTSRLHCPGTTRTPYGYAMNRTQISKPLSDDFRDENSSIVMLFESASPLRNAEGLSSDVDWGRHPSGENFVFYDGHVHAFQPDAVQPLSEHASLQWTLARSDLRRHSAH